MAALLLILMPVRHVAIEKTGRVFVGFGRCLDINFIIMGHAP